MGDAQLLRGMLANLIDNTLRYGGTRIALTVRRTEKGVTWRVADNGPGIPETQRDTVFAPFHRLSDGVDGAGLSLTIVQRIAHLQARKCTWKRVRGERVWCGLRGISGATNGASNLNTQ